MRPRLRPVLALIVASLVVLTTGFPSPAGAQAPEGGADEPRGYRLFAFDGGVFTFGDLPFAGSLGGACFTSSGGVDHPSCADGSAHPDGNGYWIVTVTCEVHAFGSARFLGDHFEGPGPKGEGLPYGCSIAPTRSGDGYWLMDGTGAVAAYGDAVDMGELDDRSSQVEEGAVHLEPTASGAGYWILGANGGVYTFGDARYHGGVSGLRLNRGVTRIVADPDGFGYWITAYDGGVFAFDAPFFGSTGGMRLNAPVNGLAPTPDGDGYWLVADDGGVFSFGDAPFFGSMGGTPLVAPVIGMDAS